MNTKELKKIIFQFLLTGCSDIKEFRQDAMYCEKFINSAYYADIITEREREYLANYTWTVANKVYGFNYDCTNDKDYTEFIKEFTKRF